MRNFTMRHSDRKKVPQTKQLWKQSGNRGRSSYYGKRTLNQIVFNRRLME